MPLQAKVIAFFWSDMSFITIHPGNFEIRSIWHQNEREIEKYLTEKMHLTKDCQMIFYTVSNSYESRYYETNRTS